MCARIHTAQAGLFAASSRPGSGYNGALILVSLFFETYIDIPNPWDSLPAYGRRNLFRNKFCCLVLRFNVRRRYP
jgi:hypothetical protein